MKTADWLRTEKGQGWLKKKRREDRPGRSQAQADYLARIIEQFKDSKRSGQDFDMPKGLSKADQNLVIATGLGRLESKQRNLHRPNPQNRAAMIDQFMKENAQAR